MPQSRPRRPYLSITPKLTGTSIEFVPTLELTCGSSSRLRGILKRVKRIVKKQGWRSNIHDGMLSVEVPDVPSSHLQNVIDELNLKHGMRDFFACPIGGRWLFAYWSPKMMQLEDDQRALLYLGAAFATTRLQKLAPPHTGRLGKGASLTPRELSVLRSLSLGHRVAEISEDLGLGEETVRSHIKKAQTKLGVRNTVQAVAQAVRLRLIP